MRALLLALSLCLGSGGAMAQQIAVPPVARVIDQTGTLTAEQHQTLSQKLAAFEQAKGSQIAVLLLPSTQPEAIEQYAIRVAEQWKLGRAGVDDGVLLLVALQDRAVRIEVGYGLEGAVPDAIAKRIVEEIILPRFREGDVYGGIAAGADRIIAVIDGEPLPKAPQRQSTADGVSGLFPVLFAFALGIGQVLRRAVGPAPAGLLLGGGAFLLVWLLVGALAMAAIAGIVVFVFTLAGLGGVGGAIGRGGFGGGGGGFRGGGGGFGGGGASGRW